MTGLLVGLELLSTLNEKDECITLLDILSYRDNKLTDLEIWAVSRECCIALKSVYNSPTMFQTLCITPDTVGFNIDGSVCFLDLGKDPESLYVPPEYDSLGNSSKGHMFSLGMTILYAAVYSSVAQPQTGLDPGVNKMIVAMTDDDYDNRPDVDEVLAVCEENLANCSVTSLKVCHWLISDAKDVFLKIYSIDSPDAELRSRSVTPDSKIVKSRNSGSTGTKSASPFSVSDNSSPVCDIISPPDLYCDSDNQEDLFTSEVPASQYREGSEICAECPRTSDCVGLRELQLSDGLKETTGVSEVRSDVTERLEGPVVDDKGHEQDAILDDNYLGQNSTSPLTNGYLTGCDNGEGSPSRDNHRGSDVMHDDDVVITGCGSNNESIDATGARSEIRHRSADGAEDNASVGDFNGYACHEGFGRNRLLASPAERESSVTTECELSDGCVEEEPSSILGAGDGVVVVEDALNELSQGDDTVRLQQTSNSPCSNAADSLPRIFMGNESSSEEATADGSGSDGKTVSKLSPGSDQCVPDRRRMGKSPDSSALDAAGCTCTGNTFASDESSQDEQGSQLVIDVVKNLGALNESELWSLCRECMLALLKCKQQLPVYISLDTVAIEADGHVTFHSMPDDKELDALYLAPELQEVGIITDKTCMFSVSAMLWSAADYSLPASEEPALSEELESLLESMIKEDEDRRPEIVTVLESCNDYQDIHGISSEQTCAALIAESKAAAYSKENTFILDVISQELQKNTLLHHAKVMECIKQAKVKLKPASERQLADRPAQDTFHDLLMNEIRNRYPLRKVGKPKEFTARDLYGHNQELLSTLVHVTRQKSFDNSDSAFTVISKSLSKPDQEMGAEPKSDVAVPHEYNSTATHFTPIEISNRKNIRPQLKLKSHFLGQKQGPSQKTSEIVKNIQEMKRNILRIQESRTLVQDLESDVQREENGSVGCDLASEPSAKRPQSQRSSGTNTSTTPSVSGNSQEGSSRKQSPNVSQPCTVPLTLGPAVLPVQYQLQQDPMTGLVNLVPVAFTQNVAGVNSPFLANQTRPLFPMMGMSMPVAGTMMPGQFLRYGTADGVGMRSEEEQDSKPRPQATSRRSSVCESPKSQVLGYNPIPEADISERLVVRSESANNILMDSKQQGENYVDLYPPSEIQKGDYPFSNNHPIRPRQVKAKDQMSKLKRAKSGSCIDYYKMANSDCSQNVAERRHGDNEPKNGQPTYMNVHDKVTRRKRYSGGLSPDIPSSPSPSLSKDSGICGINTKGFGDPALMEKLLNSNRKLSKIIHLLRDEFAYDGYMENGVEDLATAEYVMSLTNLSLNTFCGAITEKYRDLYWDESLLLNLYEVVNEEKSSHERHVQPVMSTDPSSDEMDVQNNNKQKVSSKNSELSSTRSLKYDESSEVDETVIADYPKPRWVSNKQKMMSEEDFKDAQQKWTSNWRTQDQSKSSEFVSGRDLSNATYLHNSCMDSTSVSYSLPSIKTRLSPDEEVSLGGLDDDLHVNDSLEVAFSSSSELTDNVFSTPKSQSMLDLDQCNQRIRHSTYRIVRSGDMENRRSCSLVNIGRLQNCENRSWREQEYARSFTSRPRSMVVTRSSGNLSLTADTDTDIVIHESPLEEADPGTSIRIRRSEVAYYRADVEASFKEELRRYLALQDSPTVSDLEHQLYRIDQELMLQHRNRQKSLNYFLRLAELSNKTGKASDQKPILHKTTEELEKCQNRIMYLDAARKYLEMLYCEEWSLIPEMLGALAKCRGNCPMLLAPGDNKLLQFQTTTFDNVETKVLHAGLPVGLMSYLYAEGALSEGYIHEFFYCYRYFVSPVYLLKFIINKYDAAVMSLSPESQIPLKVKSRSLDLLFIWLDGYFRIDFENSPSMMKLIEDFLEKQVSPQDACSSDLVLLLEECKDGCHVDLVFSSNTPRVCDLKDGEALQKNIGVPRKMLRANFFNHPLEDEWKSFKAALQLSAKSMKLQKLTRSQSVACIDRMNGMTRPLHGLSMERTRVRHSDGIVLMDYSPQLLAEQLTLMEQELFQKSHPIHYLNSKAQGIGVNLTGPVTRRAQAVIRLNADCEGNSDNLFVGNHTLDDVIHVLIEHAQGIAFWIASEVINCKSSRIQISLLCHLINTAKVCAELRNFATCLSMLDGLQNPLVKHLPTWRSLPSKYRRTLEQLTTLQLSIKSNAHYLMTDDNVGRCPTIPCILTFLLHVQREEVGGYKLANSMYKWSKMRSITKMVDQIRRFQQTMYDFQPDRLIQDIIRYRMQTFGGQDLTWVAAEQAQTLHLSKRKAPNVFQRMRHNFQAKKN